MAVGVPVAIGTGGTAGNTTSFAITNTVENVLPGEAVLAVFAMTSLTASLNSVTDEVGNTYTIFGPFAGPAHRIFYALCNPVINRIPINSDLIFNFTTGSYAKSVKVVKISRGTTGIKVAAPSDGISTVNSGTSTAPTSPSSGVLAQADELIVGAVVSSSTVSGETITISAPFSNLGNTQFVSGCALRLGYIITSATTAQTMSAVLSVSRAWECMVYGLKAGPLVDTLRIAKESAEYDVAGTTPRVSQLSLEGDVKGIAPRVAKFMVEADFVQIDVQVSGLSLELDAGGRTPTVASVVLEIDYVQVSGVRVPPRIIA
jgi:hypothetical protein